MRRKPTDESNSPRGGERKRKNVGRSARDPRRAPSLSRVDHDVRGDREGPGGGRDEPGGDRRGRELRHPGIGPEARDAREARTPSQGRFPDAGRRESHDPGYRSRTQRDSRAVAERVEDGERLQKVLSRAGLASRREVEEWIRAGRITINGAPAVLGVRVGPADHIRLDGRLIRRRQVGGSARVFLIHRSPGDNLQQRAEAGAQSASSGTSEVPEEPDTSSGVRAGVGAGPAILDRIPRRAGRRFIPVSPMPRVDGGLELVTSDGDLASKLQRSIRGLTSEFSVRVHGELSAQGLEAILEGVLDTEQKLEIERCEAAGGEGSNRWYSLVARGASGKDVRQLFERQGALVSRVLRTHLGSLSLDRHLSRGQYRELSPEELEALLTTAESGAQAVPVP